MNKEELLREIKAIELSKKDNNAFGYLYNKYFNSIFFFIFKRVSDRELTADLTSQVFLKALENIKKYEHRGFPFSSWLYRIAVNEVNMHYRQSNKEIMVGLTENEANMILEEGDMESSEQNRNILIEVLNELPQEYSQLIDLRFFDGHSFKDIGHIFGISEDNAKVKLYRILKKMKNLITLKNRK